MRLNLLLWRPTKHHRFRWMVRAHPVALVLIAFVLFFMVSFALLAVKDLRDSYFPYEGEVVAIKTSWLDWFLFESGNQERLIIQTPDNRTINRMVSQQIRVLHRIEVDDYIIKKRGFSKHVRPRDKRTAPELYRHIEQSLGSNK